MGEFRVLQNILEKIQRFFLNYSEFICFFRSFFELLCRLFENTAKIKTNKDKILGTLGTVFERSPESVTKISQNKKTALLAWHLCHEMALWERLYHSLNYFILFVNQEENMDLSEGLDDADSLSPEIGKFCLQ